MKHIEYSKIEAGMWYRKRGMLYTHVFRYAGRWYWGTFFEPMRPGEEGLMKGSLPRQRGYPTRAMAISAAEGNRAS